MKVKTLIKLFGVFGLVLLSYALGHEKGKLKGQKEARKEQEKKELIIFTKEIKGEKVPDTLNF